MDCEPLLLDDPPAQLGVELVPCCKKCLCDARIGNFGIVVAENGGNILLGRSRNCSAKIIRRGVFLFLWYYVAMPTEDVMLQVPVLVVFSSHDRFGAGP